MWLTVCKNCKKHKGIHKYILHFIIFGWFSTASVANLQNNDELIADGTNVNHVPLATVIGFLIETSSPQETKYTKMIKIKKNIDI